MAPVPLLGHEALKPRECTTAFATEGEFELSGATSREDLGCKCGGLSVDLEDG